MGGDGQRLVDRARVIGLEEILGMELGEVVDSLVRSVSLEIDNVDRALAAGRPQDAVHPAHRARNDGLMIGAEPLLAALIEVETAGSRGELEPATAALERVRAVWPATRDELQRCVTER
jgi:hypothetical protein